MVRGVVVVSRLYSDFVAGVGGGELVGFCGRAVDGLAVALPLVFDAVGRHAVVVFDVGGEGAAYFGIPRNADAAGLVGCVFADGGGWLAGDAFGVRLTVGVFGFDGYRLAFVRRADLIVRACPTSVPSANQW